MLTTTPPPRARLRLSDAIDVLLLLAVAASYPLYIALYAVPRVDEIGPPIPNRYPWVLAAALVALLGVRRRSLWSCVAFVAVLALGAVAAFSDDAEVTGVAVHPLTASAGAAILLLGGFISRRML
jgi:hypothetical protein